MRLICTITDLSRETPLAFSYYLAGQGIQNECEEATNTHKDQPHFYIWVYDEDDVERAQILYSEYQTNPHDPKYRAHNETHLRPKEKDLTSETNTD